MSKFKEIRDNQLFLLPPRIDDYVPENHVSRVIKEIVNQLDISSIERKYAVRGQKSYSPQIMLSLLIYSYSHGETSGREIARRCKSDLVYMFLASGYKPNFRTINSFRSDNSDFFRELFLQVLKICQEINIVKVGTIAIDGTKIRAKASKKKTYTKAQLDAIDEKLTTQIDSLLKEAKQKAEEEEDVDNDDNELLKEITSKKDLRKLVKKASQKLNRADEKINLTDHDANYMLSDGRIKPNYNSQIAVTEQGIIVEQKTTANASDRHELQPMIEGSKKNTIQEVENVLADAGYSSFENYGYLHEEGINGYLPDQEMASENKHKNKVSKKFTKRNFTYDEDSDIYICPAEKILKRIKSNLKSGKNTYDQYSCKDCPNCSKREQCTTAKYRIVKREKREGIKREILEILRTSEGKRMYQKRGHMVESIFGHIKHNLGIRMFSLRGLKKVSGEFSLICAVQNIMKISQVKLATR